MSEDPGRIYYTHFQLGDGNVTVAFRRDELENLLVVGLAFCSPKDKFVRKIGRQIAQGRLSHAPFWFPAKSDKSIMQQAADAVYFIMENGEYRDELPLWVLDLYNNEGFFLFPRAKRFSRVAARLDSEPVDCQQADCTCCQTH